MRRRGPNVMTAADGPHPGRRWRRAVAVAVVVPFALAAAACGDDGDGGDASGSSSTAAVEQRDTTTSAVPDTTTTTAVGTAGTDTPAPGEPSAAEALAIDATVIDVRTPEEFASGHIEGATNIDVESGDFDSAIAGLSHDQIYVVYCRSGRRSALAAQQMFDAGFSVLDGGSIDDMTAAGWPTA